MRVQSLDDVPDQLPGVKGDGVEGLGADPRPKGAERLGLQLLRVRPGVTLPPWAFSAGMARGV